MKTQNAAQVHSPRKAKKNPTKQVVAKSRAAVQIERAVKQAIPVSAPATAPPEVRPAAVKKGPGLVGKTSGLSKTAFIVQMFIKNEKQRKDDSYLADMLVAEFPGTATYPITGLRSKLNRGGFGEVGFESKPYGNAAAPKGTVLAKGEAAQKARRDAAKKPGKVAPAEAPIPVPEKKFVAKKAVPTIGIPEITPAATGQVAEAKDGGQ